MVSRRMSALYPHLLVWVLLTAGAGYFLYNIKQFINFGIDLVGGTYITLQVQFDRAYEYELYNKTQTFTQQLKKAGKPTPTSSDITGATARLTFDSAEDANAAYSYAMTESTLQNVTFEKSDEKVVSVSLTQEYTEKIKQHALNANVQALKGRVDQFGVGEVSVVPYGDDKIIVELPDVHNLQEAKSIIGRAALLEIKPVVDFANTADEIKDKYDDDLPEGTDIYPSREGGFFLLPKHAELTGQSLETAQMQIGGRTGADPYIAIEWDKEGTKKFAELTREHVGEPLAIVVDNEVVSSPRVSNAIENGNAQITGQFTPEQAQQLAKLLQSGSFAAPVDFVEERNIGPELGQQAIMQGLVACAVSLGLLLLFSLIVYKVAGLFAFIVLLYNLIVILLMLGALNATLTLPGIAGMILTVGMAIDASILIYEHIKEELAEGKTLRESVDSGFSGATSVILDANITHLLISVVLYELGTGPIQGFGVTMIVGIIATLLTGLWMLRYIFKVLTDIIGINKIAI